MTTTEDIREIWFVANRCRVIASADETGGRMTLLEVSGGHGSMPPLHVHRTDDEALHVIEGELTAYIGDHVVRLGPGDTGFLRATCPTPTGWRAAAAAG